MYIILDNKAPLYRTPDDVYIYTYMTVCVFAWLPQFCSYVFSFKEYIRAGIYQNGTFLSS